MKYVWPIISIILLLALVGSVAFFLGKQTVDKQASISPTQNPVQKSQEITTQPTPTSANTTNVDAGGVLVFKAYSVSLPGGWESSKQADENNNTLTLTKGPYKITISQVASEGVRCVYEGDAQTEFSTKYTNFVEIINNFGFVLRRSSSENPAKSWNVCQKNNEGDFGFPTSFGYINITTPQNPELATMKEIDGILASLKAK